MSMTLRTKLFWIAGLYFAEGFPFGIAYEAWQVYFRRHGVSLTEIGLMSLLFLPYTLKPAWAPLVDRLGSRQIWMVGAQIGLGLATLALVMLDPSQTGPALWAVLLAFTVLSATQDVAIDGYTVDVSTHEHSGAINGVRVGAYRGAMLTAGGVVALAGWIGWRSAWVVVAGAFLALAALTWKSPRVPRERTVTGPVVSDRLRNWRLGLFVATAAATALIWILDKPAWMIAVAVILGAAFVASLLDPSLLNWAMNSRMAVVLVFILLYKLGDNTLGRMVRPFWVDRGLTDADIGFISIGMGVALVIVGALFGGWLTTRWGIFAGLVICGIVQAISNFGYVAVAATQFSDTVLFTIPGIADITPLRAGIYSASFFESFTQGMGTAAFLAFLTNLCDREHGATQFAMLTATFALTRDLAGATTGFLAEGLGFPIFFLITACLAFPGLAMLPFIKNKIRTKEELEAAEDAGVPAPG